ncbi:hypothetical protein NDU88_002694 [Pleurodeles waltl]|uniref:Uncharacterized protein n=1 Tax=Pleurodeles waltl TaxID=8319 RepID=A0AAV7MNE7_PLEWA|nr:hypothetical protein NDU88_002694 [Pleurodeles waltl]
MDNLDTQHDIHEELVRHYTSLCQLATVAMPEDTASFLTTAQLPCVTQEQTMELEDPITPLEIQEAIQARVTGKTLGPDGLPTEFYKVYDLSLTPHLQAIYEEALQASHLPDSFCEALLI